jgi:hypothetical protein
VTGLFQLPHVQVENEMAETNANVQNAAEEVALEEEEPQVTPEEPEEVAFEEEEPQEEPEEVALEEEKETPTEEEEEKDEKEGDIDEKEMREEEHDGLSVEPPPFTIIDESIDAFEDQSSSSVCGDGEEIISTNCLGADSMVKSQARAVAQMKPIGCTAWLVKASTSNQGALMLSTGHCGSDSTATFRFDYIKDACGNSVQEVQCKGTRLSVEANKDEHAIYELEKSCSTVDARTPILLDIGRPDIGEGMYIIGHPNWRPQLLSHQEVHDTGHHCEVRSISKWGTGSDRVSYYCDTQGGNSGSPVFSARTGYAFAIHSHGGCSGNKFSKNWGGLLENPGNVAALNKYGIPYVNRKTANIFKYETFQKEASCFDHAGSVTLAQKTFDECKKLCVNSLTCVSIGYSPSSKKCEVNYRSTVTSGACAGDEESWKRQDALTTQLSDAIIVTTPPPPPPASACTPGTCTCGFESMSDTGCKKWKNVASDNFDWSRKSGKTPSSSTGPSKAKGGAYYMYIEASSPRKSGDKAVLRSDPVIMGSSGEVQFYYNMYGSNIASLEVQVIDAAGTSHSAWKESGNKGTAWHHAHVSLGSYAGNIEVQFVGVRGSSWSGDIAIDDITLTSDSGGGSPTTAPPTTVPPTAPPTTVPPTAPPTTMPPTAPPTTVPPTAPPTTMPPTTDLKTKVDILDKKVDEALKLVKSLLASTPKPTSPPQSQCLQKQSVGKCGKCLTSDQCANGYCCPYMKKCVETSSTQCYYPIAECQPMCYDSMIKAGTCTCKEDLNAWALPTCTSSSGLN